jgi:two-component system response regulator RegA
MTEVADDRARLLLVDDDPSFCDTLARALERRDYRVFKALDVESAWRLACEMEPEYGVVDLRIGEDSGLPLVARLAERDPEMRFIVLTGYASVATAVEAIKLGATHYLTKPADADQIVNALHRATGKPDVPLAGQPLSVRRLEWEHIQAVLQEHDGNISAAARALNMHRRTLQRKLQKRPVRK